MKALQLHYTSCRRGQSGNTGFQTRTLTSGIRANEQREIERRGIYRPPRDARQDPSEEEITRDFPRAFRFYTLESGRQALSRCRYTGQDYSGRWGNFFAHTLIFEPEDFPVALWPIDLYEWNGWKERLAAGEDTDDAPPTLPVVDLAGIEPGESFSLEELEAFLREEPGRRELLAQMGRAVLLGHANSRAVVIRDTPTQGLYWVACLQKLFPPVHARALSYSTYQDDPRGCASINATTGETDFTFDESERRFRFYIFDLATGQHSDLPQVADDYPAVAARWLAEDPKTLAGFFAFLGHFDHRQPGPDLIAAVHLFELSQGPLPEIGGERLAAMIAFASSHATPSGKTALIEILGRAASQPDAGLRAEGYSRLIRFLAEGARATGQPAHRALTFDAWLSLLRGPVLREGTGLEIAEAAWSELRRWPSSQAQELAARLLADPLCREAGGRLRELPVEIPLFLLRTVWASLELTGRIPAWEAPEVESLLAVVIARESDLATLAQAVLQAIPREPEPLAAVILQMRDLLRQTAPGPDTRSAGLAIGRGFSRTLSGTPPELAPAVRRALEAAREWDVLIGEWTEICERAADPLAAFERYRSTVFRSLPAYEEACLASAASFLLTRLSESLRTALALDWLRNGQIDRFPEKFVGQCIALANRAVSLDLTAPEGEESSRLVSEAARRHEVPLQPNRPRLRRAMATAQEPWSTLKDLGLGEIGADVKQLTKDEYTLFLDAFLVPALARVGTQADHKLVLLATYSPAQADPFQRAYLGFFKEKEKRKTPWPESLQGALRFWMSFDSGEGGGEARCLKALAETGRQGLLHALDRLQPKQLDGIRQKLHKTQTDSKTSVRWEELLIALEKRRKSPWSRLVGIFARQ